MSWYFLCSVPNRISDEDIELAANKMFQCGTDYIIDRSKPIVVINVSDAIHDSSLIIGVKYYFWGVIDSIRSLL